MTEEKQEEIEKNKSPESIFVQKGQYRFTFKKNVGKVAEEYAREISRREEKERREREIDKRKGETVSGPTAIIAKRKLTEREEEIVVSSIEKLIDEVVKKGEENVDERKVSREKKVEVARKKQTELKERLVKRAVEEIIKQVIEESDWK